MKLPQSGGCQCGKFVTRSSKLHSWFTHAIVSIKALNGQRLFDGYHRNRLGLPLLGDRAASDPANR